MIVEMIRWLDDTTSNAQIVTVGSWTFRNATFAGTRIRLLVKYAENLCSQTADRENQLFLGAK